MGKLSERLAALSAEQRELLLRKLVQRDTARATVPFPVVHPAIADTRRPDIPPPSVEGRLDFSVFFFSGDGEVTGPEKYNLLLESARFADKNGFAAVWTPERHFQSFGGLYPNPSVLAAALSQCTTRIQIRAGSVVLPLHNPIRVAEEWSVVDNLSGGRVGVAFASGYHPGDFTLAPENFGARKEIMFRDIEIVQSLWRGETLKTRGVNGSEVELKMLPKPLQPSLPVWLTSSGNPETWIKAAELGTNVLTGLAGIGEQPLADLAQKIAVYRRRWVESKRSPHEGIVTLMLHTYLGEDLQTVRNKVRAPLSGYIRTFMAQEERLVTGEQRVAAGASEEDKSALASFWFDRFFGASSLLGTPESCLPLALRLRSMGVNEIACLVDFGVDTASVLQSLELVAHLRARCDDACARGQTTTGEVGV